MRLGATIWLWLAAAGFLACGSRVEPDPDAPSPQRQAVSGGQDTSNEDTGHTGSSTDGAWPVDVTPDLPLGECVPGWSLGEADCPWFGSDQRCYATKEEACACLCPRGDASLCLSGFPNGPDGQTPVSCD